MPTFKKSTTAPLFTIRSYWSSPRIVDTWFMRIVRNNSLQIERVAYNLTKNAALLDYRTPRYIQTANGTLVLPFGNFPHTPARQYD